MKQKSVILVVNMLKVAALLISFCMSSSALAVGYSEHPAAQSFIDEMVNDYGFSPKTLRGWFSRAEKKTSILEAIERPAEKTKPWKEYQKIFVTPSRIRKGVAFWRQNRESLARAEAEFGVPAELVVAIIGVETRYGSNVGRYRVIDALSTLAFDYPKRAHFFRKELKHFLLLAREQGQDPLSLKGSYAGAMGYGQFMPSSYRSYAVDFDGDQLVDIWANPADAIGSVANYFKRHGWQAGEAVVARARVKAGFDESSLSQSLVPAESLAELEQKGFIAVSDFPPQTLATAMKLLGERGPEFWLGLPNFYVITRYNHSHLYAMAVYQLSQALKQENEKIRKLEAGAELSEAAG